MFLDLRDPVRAAVCYALEYHCLQDAVFLAERLYDEVGDVDSLYLLAKCLFQSGKLRQAKHLLLRKKPAARPDCDLLLGRICLELDDPSSSLLMLQSFRCYNDCSEDDIVGYYGNHAGVAFLLLGRCHRLLHNRDEAARMYRACLKHNPFLWTAFEALCDMGESPSANEAFTVTNYPPFLPHPHTSRHTSHHTSRPHNPTLASVRGSANECVQSDEEKKAPPTNEKPATLTPLDTNRASYVTPDLYLDTAPGKVTPDLFLDTAVGKAVASSTPFARTLAFTRADEESVSSKAGFTTSVEKGSVIDRLRVALDFGSGGHSEGEFVSPMMSQAVTPSFGSLQLTQSSITPSLITSSPQLTPSPSAPEEDMNKQLMLAPQAPKKKVSYQTPLHLTSDSEPHFLFPGLQLTKQITPSPTTFPSPQQPSIDTSTQPVVMTIQSIATATPTIAMAMQSVATATQSVAMTILPIATATPSVVTETKTLSSRTSLKSPLRRSERLHRTLSMTAPRRVGISGLVHSNEAAKLRFKSTSKEGVKSPRTDTKTELIARNSSKGRLRLMSAGVGSGGGSCGGVSGAVGEGGGGVSGAVGGGVSGAVGGDVSGAVGEGVSGGVDRGVSGAVGGGVSSAVGGGVSGAVGGGVTICMEYRCPPLQFTEQQAMASIGALMKLLQQIGTAYRHLHSYDLLTSMRLFRSLPPNHKNSCWVRLQMARIYYVGERFKEAAKIYREIHKLNPHRQEGMEYFSSCLWHLRCEVELSVLSETLIASDASCPEALCARASSLNLSRNHEEVIRCLENATKLFPRFAYGHTLLGHEYMILKDFDKALSAFWAAVSVDPRHYNAWYGQARVHFSQEQNIFAESAIRKALIINKSSSICYTQLALIYYRQKKLPLALQYLDTAAALHLNNPIPRYHRAKVLESLGQLEKALEQLGELLRRCPKESCIYFTKGKILTKLNRLDEAALNLSWGQNFNDEGGSTYIQKEIDQIYDMKYHGNEGGGERGGEGGADVFNVYLDANEELEEEEEEEDELEEG